MLETIGAQAKEAAFVLGKTATVKKNEALSAVADALVAKADTIIAANEIDVQHALEAGMKSSLVDRLKLTKERIEAMALGVKQVAELDDPIGEVIGMKLRPNGLKIGQMRVPLGVIGIIYESRPNVTADAFSLCFKTGNAVILRGGSDAIHSNLCIGEIIGQVLEEQDLPKTCIQVLKDTSRETATELMRLNRYVDVLIPRGGAGLIQSVVQNATVPVIETGTGNCHVYVDDSADLDMACDIVFNAKTQRLGVCNACESLVVHKAVAQPFIKKIAERLQTKGIELRGDEEACSIVETILPATEEDWGTEYLDAILSIKTVSSIDEAIAHINRYNTKHSETIVTKDYNHSEQFLKEVDAACVYVNASTRFTDGFEFGFGAEIGISTQKLHARGPMGLLALTTTKYVIYGDGQIRE
ncbi:MAG: glutamate-5-semialdehyde dehydrogenase [Lachnospira sp.]|nr:glutamate-5-semialdehyde dehydrogenase [Lachnospira sp.]